MIAVVEKKRTYKLCNRLDKRDVRFSLFSRSENRRRNGKNCQ